MLITIQVKWARLVLYHQARVIQSRRSNLYQLTHKTSHNKIQTPDSLYYWPA